MKLAVAVACNKGGSSSNSIISSNSKNDNVIDNQLRAGMLRKLLKQVETLEL